MPTSGNVGIGTLTPSAKLDVNGKAIIDSTLIVKDSIYVHKTLRVGQDMKVEGGITMLQNSVAKENFKVLGTLRLPNLNAPNDMSGNQLLMVKDNGAVVKSNFPAVIAELYLAKPCSQTYLDNPYWMNSPNMLFTRCPEMKVGIGTDSPQYALDVRGTGSFENGIRLGSTFNAPLPAYIEGYGSLTNSRPWMRFTTAENGIDRSVFLVEKNGNVYCTALRVRYTNDIPVPDYVFKPDYVLMPLKELKQFVQTNSHLPNIPSEKEILADGLSIEQMQMKLLEKVEELTLYVIQLEEQRIEQSEKMLEFQEEIKTLKAEIKQNN